MTSTSFAFAIALTTPIAFVIYVLLKAVFASTSKARPEDDSDPDYDAACAWRGINLAIAVPDHYEACDELADLKRAGWHIEKSGNERAGFVYLKLVAPRHKE